MTHQFGGALLVALQGADAKSAVPGIRPRPQDLLVTPRSPLGK
jgi:hypothetical protein